MSVAISDLVALGGAPATGDLLVLVDISDPTQSPQGSTKQMTVANLFESPTFTTAVIVTGTLAVSGNVAINTNKFTVAASTGNTAFAGDLAINTNKFTVTASTGRTLVGERLQIAGTTNAFPALRNTGATLEAILADASAFANFAGLNIAASGQLSAGTGAAITGNSYVMGTLGVGTTTPATSAIVELSSTTGALLLTRMTTAQRDALTPTNGMIIYNSTTAAFNKYQGGSWQAF